MNIISKTTLSYDETEDRLRVAVEDDAGQAIELWLSQRLANRLVSALTHWLDAEGHDGVACLGAHAQQSWEQSAALVQQRASQPVHIDSTARRGLIASIDLGQVNHVYSVIFRWPPDQAASLSLSLTELRQWLNIMHGLYVKAEWPRQVWPPWFDLPTAERHGQALH